MAIQVSCASEFRRAERTELRLGELRHVPLVRAHARDGSILLVLDGGRGVWERRRRRHRLELRGRHEIEKGGSNDRGGGGKGEKLNSNGTVMTSQCRMLTFGAQV